MTPARKELRNLLLLLGVSILVAITIVAFLVIRFGPGSSLVVRNILLSPESIELLTAASPSKEASIQFWRFEPKTKLAARSSVSLALYQNLFNKIAEDKSLSDVSSEDQNQFSGYRVSRLVITVPPQGVSPVTKTITFTQEVHFLLGSDLYRVELNDPALNQPSNPSFLNPSGSSKSNWAYFRHPHIEEEATRLLLGGR